MIFNVVSARLYALPELDGGYPQDASASYDYGGSKTATFKAEIAAHGNPAEYNYQWYMDNNPVGTDSAEYTAEVSAEGTHEIYCQVSNKAGTVTSRKATLTAKCNDLTLIDVSPKVAVSGSGYSQQAEYLQLKTTLNVECYLQTELLDMTAFETLVGLFDHWSNVSNGFNWKVYDESGAAVKTSQIGFGTQGTYTKETYSIDVTDLTGNHYIEFRRDATSSGAYLGIRTLTLVSDRKSVV